MYLRILAIVLAIVLSAFSNAHGKWTPPESPDPQKILDEARADFQNGLYAIALDKHIWFHHNALNYQSALSGVRLSFALSAWRDLAKVHPPALNALKNEITQSETRVVNGTFCDFDAFHDFVSLNQLLGSEHRVVSLFSSLDENRPKCARDVFLIAKSSLAAKQALPLSAKYIKPKGDFTAMVHSYERHLEYNAGGRPEIQSFAEAMFIYESSLLVATLSVDGRTKEAQDFISKAIDILDNEEMKRAMDKALLGEPMLRPY